MSIDRSPQEQASYNAWRQQTAAKAIANFKAMVKAAKVAEKGRRVIQKTFDGQPPTVVHKKSHDYLPGSIVDPAVYE